MGALHRRKANRRSEVFCFVANVGGLFAEETGFSAAQRFYSRHRAFGLRNVICRQDVARRLFLSLFLKFFRAAIIIDDCRLVVEVLSELFETSDVRRVIPRDQSLVSARHHLEFLDMARGEDVAFTILFGRAEESNLRTL